MAKYIALINWTEKGVREIKESAARTDLARDLAKELGGQLQQLYMTMGAYDLIAVLEMPDDEAAAKFALTCANAGNIRATTLKAFDETAYRKIIGSL
jgi:uncharacterized protein with GYD domain